MNLWNAPPSAKRRDKLYIIAEILEIAREGTLKTQIMYRANLSFTQLNDYLKFMLRTELLEKLIRGEKEIYVSTKKGEDFLKRYQEVTNLLKTEDDEHNGKNGVKIPPPHLLKRAQV